MMEHLNNIFHKTNTIGIHYASPKHSHNDFSVQAIEKVLPNEIILRRKFSLDLDHQEKEKNQDLKNLLKTKLNLWLGQNK